MNTLPNDGLPPDANRRDSYGFREDAGAGEDTLRLIASLPAPEGLTDRVKAGLRMAPQPGRILMWLAPLRPAGGWIHTSWARGAAAAAIVCVVAGGGWRIYSHVQPGPYANGIVMPAPTAPPGSAFSTSGATHVPETLDGPVLTHHVAPASEVNVVEKAPAQPKAATGATAMKKKKVPRRATAPVQ